MEGKERAEWWTKRAQEPAQEAVWESHGAWQTGSISTSEEADNAL